jgi:hypothetical protein
MQQIKEESRPLYYNDSSYSPELGQDYQNWNNNSSFVPSMDTWLWDNLDFYIRHRIQIKKTDSETKKKIISAFKTARKYNDTCKNNSTTDTVVTHMYVCELLAQVLCLLDGEGWSYGHGYDTKGLSDIEISDILSLKVHLKGAGLAHSLHSLFYKNKLDDSKEPTLADYLALCPETRNFMRDSSSIPQIVSCSEDYGATGAHEKDGTFHTVHFEMMDYHQMKDAAETHNVAELHARNFPELKSYSIANKYTPFSVEEEVYSDKFISTTCDPNGKRYALAFGDSRVPKQRDLEVRLAAVFYLGSLGRYRPWIWAEMENENPEEYFIMKTFLEHNHQMFPYTVLRYLSGKSFTFIKTAVWG